MKKENASWKKKLKSEEYHVLREKGTETPFTGKFLYNKDKGKYVCAACGNYIFDSKTKFNHNDCGWPSFYEAIKGSVKLRLDLSHWMIRKEVVCAKCGGHLGHVFKDSPHTPTGNRFCINSVAMDFKRDSNGKKK